MILYDLLCDRFQHSQELFEQYRQETNLRDRGRTGGDTTNENLQSFLIQGFEPRRH